MRSPDALRLGLTPLGYFGAISAAATCSYVVRKFLSSNGNHTAGFLGGSFALSYVFFIVLSGGDWMEAGRFVVPLIPIMSSFIIAEIHSVFNAKNTIKILCAGVASLALTSAVNLSISQSTGVPFHLRDEYNSSIKEYSEKFSYFENYKRSNARDFAVIERMKHVINAIKPHEEKVTILSGQMGIVMYHMKKYFGSSIEVVDTKGLVENQIRECSEIEEDFEVGRFGTSMSKQFILDNQSRLSDKCGVSQIDIVYHFHSNESEMIESKGYSVVYSQSGNFRLRNTLFKGTNFAMMNDQLIAVREELIEYIEIDNVQKEYPEGNIFY